jgi:hypothetical protein
MPVKISGMDGLRMYKQVTGTMGLFKPDSPNLTYSDSLMSEE